MTTTSWSGWEERRPGCDGWEIHTRRKGFQLLVTKDGPEWPGHTWGEICGQGDSVAIFKPEQMQRDGISSTVVLWEPGTSSNWSTSWPLRITWFVTSPFFFSENDDEELSAGQSGLRGGGQFAPTIHPACAYDCIISDCPTQWWSIGDGEKLRDDAIQQALAESQNRGVTGALTLHRTAACQSVGIWSAVVGCQVGWAEGRIWMRRRERPLIRHSV